MKNLSRVRVAVALLLCGAMCMAYARAQTGEQAAQQRLVKISDDLYVIHNDFVPGNATALITSEGVILVDDKFAIDHDNIVSQLRKVTSRQIRYVINTHHHADHSGGNAKMQQINAQVIVSEQARENMAAVTRSDPQWSAPNIAFQNHLSIDLGGKRVELYQFGRAHTNGDVVVYFPAARALVAGDLLVSDPGTPQLIDYAAGGSAKEWTKTLDSVLQLDFDAVVPGHGDVTTRQELRRFRDSTIVLRNRVHEMIVQKKTRDDIARMLERDFHWVGAARELLMVTTFDGLIGEMQ